MSPLDSQQQLFKFLTELLNRPLSDNEKGLVEVLDYLWQTKSSEARKLERALESLVKSLRSES